MQGYQGRIWSAATVLGACLLFWPVASIAAPPSRMKICGDEWSAAKAADKVPAGQTWKDFYKVCSTRLKAEEKPAAPHAGKSEGEKGGAVRAVSSPAQGRTVQQEGQKEKAAPAHDGQKAARTRQKQCGAEWKKLKAAGQVPAGQKWPQFWSACNARLKKI